ncbi:MAG: hypothetical protein Q8936_12715 [Bacillota bacterium]|nr:hypothetical protein [Bacillota bacterium]
MKRISILSIVIALIVSLLSACSFNTKTVKYSSKDLDKIKQATKYGLTASLTYSYETTTGNEGTEYFTERLIEEVHETKDEIPGVIQARKNMQIVTETNITNIRNIEIVDENHATAIADYKEKTTSNMKDKYNHNWTGYFDVKLKKESGKWLIDDFQTHTYIQ